MIRRMLARLPRRSRTELELENADLKRQLMLHGLYIYWLHARLRQSQRPVPHPVRRYRWRTGWPADREVVRR